MRLPERQPHIINPYYLPELTLIQRKDYPAKDTVFVNALAATGII